MKHDDAMRLVKTLLDNEGAEWTEENGWLRFRTQHGAALWETVCRVCEGGALFYGRFPFRAAEPDKARRACEELNRVLVRGALFLDEDGSIVYRCRAELDDVYGAEERIAAALRYGAQVVTHYWGRLSRL